MTAINAGPGSDPDEQRVGVQRHHDAHLLREVPDHRRHLRQMLVVQAERIRPDGPERFQAPGAARLVAPDETASSARVSRERRQRHQGNNSRRRLGDIAFRHLCLLSFLHPPRTARDPNQGSASGTGRRGGSEIAKASPNAPITARPAKA